MLLCSLACLAWACDGGPAPSGAPDPAASSTPSVAVSAAAETAREAAAATPDDAPAAFAGGCSTADATPQLSGPSATDGHDLDLQFGWRAATACQDLHPLEKGKEFGPLEKLVVRSGEGHRVLLLIPSLEGRISSARYRVALSDTADAELVAWVTLEEAAAAQSDGVEFGVAVRDASEALSPADVHFERLTGEQARAGWRALHVDLAAYRGKTVWLALASRERGTRQGDWLLWGDPRIVVKQSVPLRVDLAAVPAAADPVLRTPPWSEVNVFKAYSGFNEDEAVGAATKWVSRMFPWLHSLRLFSSLGASWGPTLERDYEAQMGHNPTRDSREEAHWAKYYEFFNDGPGFASTPIRKRFAWRHFDTLLARIAETGMRLHVNLSGAPELFTGGKGHYHTYHFNEMPVVDEAGWKTYVDAVFRHLSRQPWFERAEFSFFSEPNCRWIADDGSVRHFGYQGDAAQYARQYLWTWQAMKPYVKPGQVHLGPFVVEPDPAVPVIDNLPEHLRLLRETFRAAHEPLPPWSAFSFNIYETPQLAIDHFASYKIDYVRRLLPLELPGRELPLRFDEVGIHPLITAEFAAAGVPAFEGSRWSAAWHAEMLALLVEQKIVVGSPWLHNAMMRPYASYALLSLASRAFAAERDASGALAIVPRTAHDGAGAAGGAFHVRLGSASADRIGYLWSAPAGDATTRLALWHFPRFPASDARLAAEQSVARVRVALPDCADAGCKVVVLGYDDQSFAALPAQPPASSERVALAAIPGLPALRRVETVRTGELELGLRPGEVYLVEVTRLAAAP